MRFVLNIFLPSGSAECGFPGSWRNEIERVNEVGVSPVSCYEIALAHNRKRLELPCPASQWLKEALTPAKITLLPLTEEIACKAVHLSPIHKDPFDRLIIATALVYNAKLASVDSQFLNYSELREHLMQ
ncbi:MAG: type II toxin-antitoxin system VapC family toxin [Acaryochloris sp. CRU_2_0]|nr:type II toxin-antitoxin system VapC family toxin [Acaryochloris sp. CRU_2_0]